MKKTVKLFSLLMGICMIFSSCAQSVGDVANMVVDNGANESVVDNVVSTDTESTEYVNADNVNSEQLSELNKNEAIPEKGTYNEGVALVKYDGEMTDNVLSQLNLISATALYSGSSWYTVELKADADTVETVTYLRSVGCFDKVDYDYIMKADAEIESVDISGNTYAEDLTYLETLGVKKGWEHNANNKKTPGGSPDVVIAIIDTGVDYNHLDLRNNIWVNPAEIPENGIDDDGNGYIDDVHGWDCVGDDNDPMDDNGHGTHVAGIAAAENNKLGTVGVAYNCKIMVLKAGASSGYFNSSDIAEAIQYAYMNGASVINMSFGGASISFAVEEALKDAYNQCVLVAAAGNDGKCNQPGCPDHIPQPPTPFYPASLTYVIGVMSCDATGSYLSGFSNFDHYPYYGYEYDVLACGESIQSTWPNNKYAALSGTSMACPTVAGIAAVVRSTYSDREMYSSKFITAQIVSTVSREDSFGVANLHKALTETPKPYIYNIYDQYIFDNVEFSPKNNGNGVIDAGETIRLAVELQNRGGMASNVVAKIDTIRNDDPDLTDPYFTITQDTIHFSDIGTYSVRDCGKLYDEDGNWIGTEKYFEFIVADNCPNSYLVDFNLRLSYQNGLDENDDTVYEGVGSVLCNVNRGYHLSGVIAEDTIFEADRHYIISSDVVIPADVIVTFKEGCTIQFYDNREYYNSPTITVYGTLNFEGTAENMIKISPDEHHEEFSCRIYNRGVLNVIYVNAVNLHISSDGNNHSITNAYINHSYLRDEVTSEGYSLQYSNAAVLSSVNSVSVYSIENSYIDFRGMDSINLYAKKLNGCFVHTNSYGWNNFRIIEEVRNNIFNSGVYHYDIYPYNPEPYYYFGEDYIEADCMVENNVFYSEDDNQPMTLVKIKKAQKQNVVVRYNKFSKGYQTYASQIIEGYYDAYGIPTLDVYGSLADKSTLWPHVVNVEIFDKDGNPITKVGKEEIKVRVTFNKPMDTTQDTFMSFGTVVPYDDYRINGEWVSDTVWEGSYTLKAQIENGQNFLKVNNACAAEDPTKVVFGEYQLHEFTIDTTAAMSMNLQAITKEDGIELTFEQDDYDTLLGYNIYRADSKDGNYVKLNPTILMPTENTFFDENAEPGKTYWYTYTVVLTDFSESNPAGKVVATAMDTLAPNMYHTPVNQGYMNNSLVIACTASDNVAISTVTLYYRTIGATEWKTLTMSKQSDKYSATIFGSDLTLDGIEYYIVASDGRNTINKGTAETPYKVVIKDASAISRKGDVDGDGVVTTKDALMLMQCINGDLILSDDEFKRADLNGDGVLNSSEALRILQYINGKVSTLEM